MGGEVFRQEKLPPFCLNINLVKVEKVEVSTKSFSFRSTFFSPGKLNSSFLMKLN